MVYDATISTIGGTILVEGFEAMAKRAGISTVRAMRNRVLTEGNSYYDIQWMPLVEGNTEWNALGDDRREREIPWTYASSFDAGTAKFRAAVSSARAQQSANLWRSGAKCV